MGKKKSLGQTETPCSLPPEISQGLLCMFAAVKFAGNSCKEEGKGWLLPSLGGF